MPWPMFFLAQINLATIPPSVELPNVPKTGTLFFFWDPLLGTSDCKVIYVDERVSKYPPRQMPEPEYRPVDEWSDDDVFDALERNLHEKWSFDFLEIDTFELSGRNATIDNLIQKSERSALRKAEDLLKDRWTKLRPDAEGYPVLIYLFGSEAEEAQPAKNQRLLLTITGSIVHRFWVPEDALAARDFDKVSMTKFE